LRINKSAGHITKVILDFNTQFDLFLGGVLALFESGD